MTGMELINDKFLVSKHENERIIQENTLHREKNVEIIFYKTIFLVNQQTSGAQKKKSGPEWIDFKKKLGYRIGQIGDYPVFVTFELSRFCPAATTPWSDPIRIIFYGLSEIEVH